MQTLIFYTKSKKTELRDVDSSAASGSRPGKGFSDGTGPAEPRRTSTYCIIYEFSFENVSTVAIRDAGYYEIMQTESGKTYPVGRLPISNTNMLIKDE